MEQIQVIKNFSNMLKLITTIATGMKEQFEKRKKQAFWYKLSMVIIASSITLVLGLKIEPFGNSIALVLSSILSVLTIMDQFQNITTRHITLYKRMSELTLLIHDLNLYLTENNHPTEEKLKEFHDRFQETMRNAIQETITLEGAVKEQVQKLSSK